MPEAVPSLLPVLVSASRGGTAPMTWGQRAIWKSIRWLGDEAAYFNLSQVHDVPPGHSVEALRQVIGRLVAAHDSLRTTWVDYESNPSQTIASDVTLLVSVEQIEKVREAGEPESLAPGATTRAAAEDVAERLRALPFSPTDIPVRFALIVESESREALHLAIVVNHQVVDGLGFANLRQHLQALLTYPDAEGVAPAWQPQDQAAFEASPEGQRRNLVSSNYWEARLRSIPASMFDYEPMEPEHHRFWRVGMNSVAAAVAATRIADRVKASTSSVLLTATSLVLSVISGRRDLALQLIIGNRADQKTAGLVGALAENGLLSINVDECGFDQTVRTIFRSTLAAYQAGYYDPMSVHCVMERLAFERGVSFDLSAFFNDARSEDRWDVLPPVESLDDLQRLVSHTSTSVIGTWPRQDAKFFMHTEYAPRELRLFLMADTAYIGAEAITQVLRAVEQLLVKLAFQDASLEAIIASLDLPKPERLGRWLKVGPDWANLDAVHDVLRIATSDSLCHIAIEEGPGTTASLIAHVRLRDAHLKPANIYSAVLHELESRTDAVAPQRYAFYAAKPGAPADEWWTTDRPLVEWTPAVDLTTSQRHVETSAVRSSVGQGQC